MKILSTADLKTAKAIRTQLIEASKNIDKAQFDAKADRASKIINTMEWHTIARGIIGNQTGMFRLHWAGPSQEGTVIFYVSAIDGHEPKITILSNETE